MINIRFIACEPEPRSRKRKPPVSVDKLEFDRDEWLARPAKLRRRVVKCECGRKGLGTEDHGSCVFVCRDVRTSFVTCGRYCCSCVGSGEDEIDIDGTMCSECWCKKRDKVGGTE